MVRKKTKLKKKPVKVQRGVIEIRAQSGDRSRTELKGPNTRKRHRKADEIYGDTSIPDSARRE